MSLWLLKWLIWQYSTDGLVLGQCLVRNLRTCVFHLLNLIKSIKDAVMYIQSQCVCVSS